MHRLVPTPPPGARCSARTHGGTIAPVVIVDEERTMPRRWITSAALAAAVLPAAAQTEVPYPAGYRGWMHVKSMTINAGHPLYEAFGGIHHLYANPKAVAGYRSGKFADGSVIVFDLLDARSADNAVTEGARKVVGVMHRDAKRYAATGGWGYEGFKGDTRERAVTQAGAAKACFGCHEQVKDKAYVFSALRP
jgi:Cytochrome P460